MLRKVVKKLAVNCDEMFTITKTEAKDTDDLFGTKSVVLTKGIDYSNLQFKEIKPSNPIKMVYTGNLLIGRANSLVEISKALKDINKAGEVATLDIYSPTVLDDKTMSYLNSNGCHYKGAVSKEEVAKIQNDADIVIFVESLEKAHRYDARLSFSTKLTDYFASGKCIFAIGDKSIAPIEYLKENDAAIIVNDYSDIENKLRELIDNPKRISEYGKKAFDCGFFNMFKLRINIVCPTFKPLNMRIQNSYSVRSYAVHICCCHNICNNFTLVQRHVFFLQQFNYSVFFIFI